MNTPKPKIEIDLDDPTDADRILMFLGHVNDPATFLNSDRARQVRIMGAVLGWLPERVEQALEECKRAGWIKEMTP